MDNFIVRPARVEDIQQLTAIENGCFSADKCFLYSAQHFKYIIKKAQADLLVIADNLDNIMGYILQLYRSNSALAHLYSVAVDPLYRRNGIGRKLFDMGEKYAAAKNCRSIILEVRGERDDLVSMYSHLGYKRDKMLKMHYPDKMHAIRMKKRLEVF